MCLPIGAGILFRSENGILFIFTIWRVRVGFRYSSVVSREWLAEAMVSGEACMDISFLGMDDDDDDDPSTRVLEASAIFLVEVERRFFSSRMRLRFLYFVMGIVL